MQTENYFKNDAKAIVDMLFENKLFIESLKRDDLMAIENFIASELQSKFESITKMQKLIETIKPTHHDH